MLTQPTIISESDDEMDENVTIPLNSLIQSVSQNIVSRNDTQRPCLKLFRTLEPCKELRVGYMDPGHGWRGKQLWITSDDDL